MKPKLELQLLKTIRRMGMILPGDRVGVGVSGGADSVALFRLLEALRKDLGITLLILHFDHCLRGEESAADAQFVKSLARDHHVEFVCDRADVSAFAKKHRLNLEDAARRLRYAFFERVVAEGRVTRVAIAHTADDQAETVLARLFRGTGPSGLAGIYPTLGAVVRPLLDYRREDLRDYLRALGQTWREDTTNPISPASAPRFALNSCPSSNAIFLCTSSSASAISPVSPAKSANFGMPSSRIALVRLPARNPMAPSPSLHGICSLR